MSIVIPRSESSTYTTNIEMSLIICCSCAIPFAVPLDYKQSLKKTQDSFYCPNGHRQSYSKSTAEILQEKLAKVEQEKQITETRLRDIIESKERQILFEKKEVVALKSKHTKLKNRIAHGVCPCCKRTFQNIYEHIKNEHPEYKNEIEK